MNALETMQQYTYEFSGARLCLDFANTVSDRLLADPKEHLNSYSDIVAWGWQAQMLTTEQAERLLTTAQEHVANADQIYRQAIQAREAIFRTFIGLIKEQKPEQDDLHLISQRYADVTQHGQLQPAEHHFAWNWSEDDPSLELVLWPVMQSTIELLTSDDLNLLRVCAADDCNWLFVDTSKNRSRRWCDMKSCGNRAKVRRHYARAKKEQTSQANE